MLIITGARQNGKTLALIELARETNTPILTSTLTRARNIDAMAIKCGLPIRPTLSYASSDRIRGPVLVDEIEDVFYEITGQRIIAATTKGAAVEPIDKRATLVEGSSE